MKILVGYDGSNVSKEALKLAMTHTKAFKGEIFVVNSLTGGGGTTEDEVRKANSHLEEAKRFLDQENIPGDTHLLIRGHTPGEDIVQFADENDMDEIIIGIRRRSKVGKLIFGSNAQYIILKASCPVVTVK